jgi:hypothetical protein
LALLIAEARLKRKVIPELTQLAQPVEYRGDEHSNEQTYENLRLAYNPQFVRHAGPTGVRRPGQECSRRCPIISALRKPFRLTSTQACRWLLRKGKSSTLPVPGPSTSADLTKSTLHAQGDLLT